MCCRSFSLIKRLTGTEFAVGLKNYINFKDNHCFFQLRKLMKVFIISKDFYQAVHNLV